MGKTKDICHWEDVGRGGITVYERTAHSSNIKTLKHYAIQILLFLVVNLTPKLALKIMN